MVSITHRWNENYTDSVPQILGKVLNLNKKNITHMNNYCIWQCASITPSEISIYLPFSEFQNGKYHESSGQQFLFLCQGDQSQWRVPSAKEQLMCTVAEHFKHQYAVPCTELRGLTNMSRWVCLRQAYERSSCSGSNNRLSVVV